MPDTATTPDLSRVRYVTTTQSSGYVMLRYAPREPHYVERSRTDAA